MYIHERNNRKSPGNEAVHFSGECHLSDNIGSC